MKIAVLAEDRNQAGIVCEILESERYVCKAFDSGMEMLSQLRGGNYEMLIIDWRVADLTAVELFRWIRSEFSKVIPIMCIANHADEHEAVEGLSAGADSYLIKPIRRNELVARVKALIRLAYPSQNVAEKFAFGDYLFDTRACRLTVAEELIDIKPKEFSLALMLFRNLGVSVSRAQILEEVWSRGTVISSQTLNTHISRIREKLRLRPEGGFRLCSIYRYGYRLDQLSVEKDAEKSP
ncbi:response regulator transcription factor [Collimonas arenae]|uniref:response regulator transcription factor n=1 Tax=Collimonas arenae TaxID=279058 RepID=UPI00056FB994|nr:response regulator transcription factor [Collimonas arenae]